MEAREFAPVYNRYRNDQVIFLTVDIDPRNSIVAIEQFRIDTETPWTYTDANGGKELIEAFGIRRFERTFVLDKEGVIRFEDGVITTTEQLDQAIAAALTRTQ